jgi:hypothetical protein
VAKYIEVGGNQISTAFNFRPILSELESFKDTSYQLSNDSDKINEAYNKALNLVLQGDSYADIDEVKRVVDAIYLDPRNT